MQSKKTILVPVAEGSEEIEFSTIFDVVDRCGIEPLVLAVGSSSEVKLAHGLHVRAPHSLKDYVRDNYSSDVSKFVADIDAVLLPGGMPGATNLRGSAELQAILSEMKNAKKLIGAVCASPAVVLAPLAILGEASKATCYPAMRTKFDDHKIEWTDEAVVYDNESRVLTSQGPGTTAGFALVACAMLVGVEVPLKVNTAMLTGWESTITNLGPKLSHM